MEETKDWWRNPTDNYHLENKATVKKVRV